LKSIYEKTISGREKSAFCFRKFYRTSFFQQSIRKMNLQDNGQKGFIRLTIRPSQLRTFLNLKN